MEELFNEIRQYKDKSIIICGATMYHILLSIMIINECECLDNSLLFLFSYKKREIDEFRIIKQKLIPYGIRTRIFDKKSKIFRALKITDIKMAKEYKAICHEYGIVKGDFLLINFAWSFKRIQYPASMFFKKCQSAIFIQDGATQYMYPRETKLFLAFKQIYDHDKEFWTNTKLKLIYSEHPDKYPDYMQSKMQLLLMNNKKNIVSIIKDVFNIEQTSIDYMNKAEGIIFTQPLSEDGLVTEREKLEIYENIVKFYSQYGKVCLKIHPRDYSNYENFGVPIIYDRFPSEILSLLGIHFAFAIGIFTSAVDTVNADIKINIGEEFPENKKIRLFSL